MATVIDFTSRRHPKKPNARNGRSVTCAQCGERHPVIRLTDGKLRCVTAFADGERWFCRNRGCRAAWLARHGER
jgi:hypothetical protein